MYNNYLSYFIIYFQLSNIVIYGFFKLEFSYNLFYKFLRLVMSLNSPEGWLGRWINLSHVVSRQQTLKRED